MFEVHSNNGMYNCHLCENVTFKDKDLFLYHLTESHSIGEYLYKCEECNKAFYRKNHLNVHLKNTVAHIKTERIKNVVCDKCGEGFFSNESLQSHLKRIHHEYKINPEALVKKCETCAEEFHEPEMFDSHLKSCSKASKDFKCKYCDTKWASHLSLEMHIAISHKKLFNICDICGQCFFGKSKLASHKKIVHDKIHDFVCHICAKPCSTKSFLKTHLVTAHAVGERRFKCDKCDKSYATSSAYKNHYQSNHEKSELYQCELCPKTFWVKDYLKTHIRVVHEKHRPHKCDICNERFLYGRDVTRHKKFHHNII